MDSGFFGPSCILHELVYTKDRVSRAKPSLFTVNDGGATIRSSRVTRSFGLSSRGGTLCEPCMPPSLDPVPVMSERALTGPTRFMLVFVSGALLGLVPLYYVYTGSN